ncbi:angiotensinogen [Dromiciops gliroides]|uniref:angiotensinogen n=1 Tax=Dromiciops gliroides TaxID=33562 RepID=UPI001CC3F4C1|nr:angiotensinogen [Dromiciops gliroides]XP_043858459.1 angiotensinogen [Dromiciops gliroides]XP_043858460.1 angiotensinogen [Dromiciops gliroides]
MLLRVTVILLGLTALVVSDRVYVHPFHLLTYNQSSCEEQKKLDAETSEEQTTPFSIQDNISPLDEVALKAQLVSYGQTLDAEDKKRATGVGMLLNFVGFRMYKMLRDVSAPANGAVLLSPVGLFGTLISFYLGSVNTTATKLQAFLGVLGEDQSCTSQLDGYKVLSALKAVQSLLLAHEEKDSSSLLLTTVVGLFTSPNLRLKRSFLQGLAPFASITYSRSLDLATNPDLAAEKIDSFIEAVTGWTMSTKLTGISPDTTLLFTTYMYFQGAIKGITQLAEPQVFWINNTTKISVPVLSGTGIFLYWNDIQNNFSVTQVPFNENAFLLLFKPENDDLEKIENLAFGHEFSTWMKNLSPRKIHLTLPKLVLESSYDMQNLLTYTKLPGLLGEEAMLSKISDANLKVGKVMNTVLFELKESQGKQDLFQKQKETVSLEVKLDKPFLLALYEQESKSFCLLSRVTNPLSSV